MSKKLIIWLIVSVLLSVIVLFIVKQIQKSKAAKAAADAASPTATGSGNKFTDSSSASTQAPVQDNSDYPIIYGKKSEAAKKLQWYIGVKQDGIIGPVSLAAWQKYDSAVTNRFKISNEAELNNEIALIQSAKNNTNSVADAPIASTDPFTGLAPISFSDLMSTDIYI
jgi:hypothetical protein